jgi:HEPN domain-containing protein
LKRLRQSWAQAKSGAKKYIVVFFLIWRKAFLCTRFFVKHESIDTFAMVNIEKQVDYWRKGAEEDLPVGFKLVQEGNLRHGLFFIHLAFEKILKAHVCRKTGKLSPRSHNIFRLLEMSGLQHSREDALFLANLNKYNIEGRYPDSYEDLPDSSEVIDIISTGGRIFQWLHDQL